MSIDKQTLDCHANIQSNIHVEFYVHVCVILLTKCIKQFILCVQ